MNTRIHPSSVCAGLLALLACANAVAQTKCPVTTTLAVTSASSAASQGLLSQIFSSKNCDSVRTVLALMFKNEKVGGRKLEKDKPLDIAAAQRERDTALQDPTFAQELADELRGETVPARRLVLEAALLHENGHYKARDLLIEQARTEAAK